MLNKNDPLIAAVQKVMETNQAERNAVAVVNEKFGVTDRRALPRERQHEWDFAYAKVLTEGVEALDEKKNMSKGDIAALRHPKKKFTGDDLAALRADEHKMEEAKKMKDDPCWDTHEMVGMKKGKGGKPVPNCVPVKEEGIPGKAIRGDVVTGGSSVTSVAPKEKSVTPSDQSALKKKIQSVIKEASEKQKNKVSKVMKEFGKGSLHSGKGGPVVTDRKHAVAIALSQAGLAKAKKKLEEGFNNRHDLSVTASVEEQVVAEQTSPMPVSGVQNSSWFSRKTDMQRATQDASKVARLRAMRKKSPALSPDRDARLDTRTDKTTELGNTLDSVLVPFAGAKQKFDAGDKKGAAIDAAIDTATIGLGGPIARLGKKVVDKGIDVYRASSKIPKVDNVAQAGTTASQAAPKTSQVANNFRANLANRRYNVSGAQQRPPQSVTPAAQSSVPQIAQGTGQGNRLAATRRADSGPWGGTPPAASASKLKVAPGGFAANLQRARQQAQSGRAGVNTAQATQAATRAANARQSSQALGGFGNTVSATNALRARQSSQALGGLSKTTNATNALRARQSSQALGGFGRATSSLGNLVKKNPKLAAGAAAGAAMTGFAATQVGNKPPSAQAAGVAARKIEAPKRNVSDTEIMNSPVYKKAVSSVGGDAAARRLAVGKDVEGVGKLSKGDTIWSKTKDQLSRQAAPEFKQKTDGRAGR